MSEHPELADLLNLVYDAERSGNFREVYAVLDGMLVERDALTSRVGALEARGWILSNALRDLLPWAGKQTFEDDAVWVHARSVLEAGPVPPLVTAD